jgi:hypothetical protein
MASVTNINEVLSGHVGLEVHCADRLLLNAYVPNLQVSGQMVTFLTQHLGFLIPSPTLPERIGNRFRREVKAEADGRFGVVAIIAAQEFQWIFSAKNRSPKPGVASFDFVKEERRVGMYYFYILDAEFGPTFKPEEAHTALARRGEEASPLRVWTAHRGVQVVLAEPSYP